MALVGGPESVAAAILRLADQLDPMGLALIFKLGAMPYEMVERSMTRFGEEVMPRISRALGRRGAVADRDAAAPSLQMA
jgi:alkanesulfonate monooxygenase SsuD/methylene tetrahydromethanopterin reductase-like flavin-dependent oxidoreductase (luciferase family)